MNRVRIVICLLLSGCAAQPDKAAWSGCEFAERYAEASMAGDSGRLAEDLAPEVAAIFLSDENDHGDVTEGRSAVLAAIDEFPAQCPGCRSSLVCHLETPHAAYLTETVTWKDATGESRNQSAPLVIERAAQGVIRIVYFPAD